MKNKLTMGYAVKGSWEDVEAVWNYCSKMLRMCGHLVEKPQKMMEMAGVIEVYFLIEAPSEAQYTKFYQAVSTIADQINEKFEEYVITSSIYVSMGHDLDEILAMDECEYREYSFYKGCIDAAENRKRNVELSQLNARTGRLEGELEYMAATIRSSGCINTFPLLCEMNEKLQEKGLPYIVMPDIVH